MEKRNRNASGKVRCGVTPLQVEIGRYSAVKVETCLCTLCACNKCDKVDECHALIFWTCDFCDDINQNMTFLENVSLCRFLTIAWCRKSNEKIINNSAMFCRNILDCRKQFMSSWNIWGVDQRNLLTFHLKF